jgi:hypothetical protein
VNSVDFSVILKVRVGLGSLLETVPKQTAIHVYKTQQLY